MRASPVPLLLLAAAMAAGPGTAGAEAGRDERLVEGEVLDLVGRLDRQFDSIERTLRELRAVDDSLEASPREETLARGVSLCKSLGRSFEEARELRERHLKRRQFETSVALLALIRTRKTGGASPAAAARDKLAADDLHDRNDALSKAWDEERARFEGLARGYAETRRAGRLGRALGAVAASAAAVIALLWLRLRRRSPVPAAQAAQLPPPTPAEPVVIGGQYRLLRLLGKGSMGLVYEAEDLELKRKVAVKQLRQEAAAGAREMDQLLAEARAVASLKHPNIVGIYAIVPDAGRLHLILELVEGSTLQKVLDERPRLEWRQALHVLRQAAAALEHAHARKVIHRDLKPSNIMLTARWEAKVMDFGIAYQAKRTAALATRAEAWGTPPYMAPEQELGTVSSAVDLFALAVCFYEMVAGEVPFPGPNYLAQKREARFAPASGLSPGLPAGADEVFRRALAPEPSRRYAGAAELYAAFAALR